MYASWRFTVILQLQQQSFEIESREINTTVVTVRDQLSAVSVTVFNDNNNNNIAASAFIKNDK